MAGGSHNLYSPMDVAGAELPAGERVFISHRMADKPLASALAALFDGLGLHYWFDRDDEDLRRAAALGMAGDMALVHAIERGIRHSSRILGVLTENTAGSWWVPYEIGFARSSHRPATFLMTPSVGVLAALPEYVRLAANYWSVDEVVRWADGLVRGGPQAGAARADMRLIRAVERFVPREPPTASPAQLADQALAAIAQLDRPETQEALRLTSQHFDWLPTDGGIVRDIAYDLFAPLAFFQFNGEHVSGVDRDLLQAVYRSVTEHHQLARQPPLLQYDPEVAGWRQRRYQSPASCWLQGLSAEQLRERLDRFFLVPDLNRRTRLATREEFKAEFDRVLRSTDQRERRSLGVLLNPLFGFNPTDRPVYCRVLARQQGFYRAFARTAGPPGTPARQSS